MSQKTVQTKQRSLLESIGTIRCERTGVYPHVFGEDHHTERKSRPWEREELEVKIREPATLAKRQYFLPILSDILPNKGHARNARRPFTVSNIPTTA
jgi:hypothetical protein